MIMKPMLSFYSARNPSYIAQVIGHKRVLPGYRSNSNELFIWT